MFAKPIGQVLYQSEEIGFYLGILGPLMPFFISESMVDGMLKGVDQQFATFRYTMLDSVLRIVAYCVLCASLGNERFFCLLCC